MKDLSIVTRKFGFMCVKCIVLEEEFMKQNVGVLYRLAHECHRVTILLLWQICDPNIPANTEQENLSSVT